MSQPILELEGVSKKYAPSEPDAVKNFSMKLEPHEILTLVGPSGCGKTTVLRLIAGFEEPDEGTIKIKRKIVSKNNFHLVPNKRDVGMVFQDLALFPHLTVHENIAFGLKKEVKEREERIQEVLALVGLESHQNRYPEEMSGGQRQRVALARSLVVQPRVLLMDEPFTNLDKDLRDRMRRDVKKILKKCGIPTIFVTHDQEEALFLGDRMAVMNRGRLEQIGAPEQVVVDPDTRFVAHFLGPTDFIPANKKGKQVETEIGELPLGQVDAPDTDTFDLMVRADDIVIQPVNGDRGNGVIDDCEFLGGMFRYGVRLPSGRRVHSLVNHAHRIEEGTPVNVKIAPGHPLVGFAGPCSSQFSNLETTSAG